MLREDLDEWETVVGSATGYRKKAELCRRFAGEITNRDDPAIRGLFELAKELDARAAEIEGELRDELNLASSPVHPRPSHGPES
jgi:hypothetical protein